MTTCTKGQHSLINIMSRYSSEAPDARTVVRWCTECGAIVIDTDIDGRTAPGDVMKMRLPTISKPK